MLGSLRPHVCVRLLRERQDRLSEAQNGERTCIFPALYIVLLIMAVALVVSVSENVWIKKDSRLTCSESTSTLHSHPPPSGHHCTLYCIVLYCIVLYCIVVLNCVATAVAAIMAVTRGIG